MAQNFRNQLTHKRLVLGIQIYYLNQTLFDTVVGIRLVNVTTSSINVIVAIENSSNDTGNLIKLGSIPGGSSLELIDGGEVKII